MTKNLFEFIKNKNINELIKIIKKDDNINLNIMDETYNYFINYVLLYNFEDLLDIMLTKNIRLDIIDTDGRSILYIPIKYSYNSILKKLLSKDSKNIGLSIIDLKDKLGLTSLHYSIIFNNKDAFYYLLENNANYLSLNNQQLNSFHICIQYNRYDFFIELLNKVNEINIYTKTNESLLQFSILYGNNNFSELILKNKININNQEDKNGVNALHQAILKNNIHIVKLLILNGININSQDFYGNTPLHYAINEKNNDMIKLLLNYSINYNLTNIDGNTILHTYIENKDYNNDILEKLIKNTDLNIQNNIGITSLNLILSHHLFNNFKHILETKELNFFIQDIYGNDMSSALNDENIIDTAINSYYKLLKDKKDDLFDEWEKWCSIDAINKLKTLKINFSESKDICKEKIKNVINNEKRTLPKYQKLDLILDNGIFVNTCYYTGVPLDIVFGLVFLKNIFKKEKFSLVLDYPLTINQNLEQYYEKLGIDFPFKLEFSNCEILWSYQKIFFPSYFDHEFDKLMNDQYVQYITIPIGIELASGSHANILFIDKNNKQIERFEPNGANYPIGLNYNPDILDEILKSKFDDYDLKYIKPKDFLPNIGFQILENIEESKCKRIGDPNGFCGVWCIWWVYHRMKNINIPNNILPLELIKKIKMDNNSFKNIIRNFSQNITELRDSFLIKYKIDINNWMVGNVNEKIINNLEKDIFNNISK